MKKLHNKIIAACGLALLSSSPILANAALRTPPKNINTVVTTPGGLRTMNLNTTGRTPASILLQLRGNSDSGITSILPSITGIPTIVHPSQFLGKQ